MSVARSDRGSGIKRQQRTAAAGVNADSSSDEESAGCLYRTSARTCRGRVTVLRTLLCVSTFPSRCFSTLRPSPSRAMASVPGLRVMSVAGSYLRRTAALRLLFCSRPIPRASHPMQSPAPTYETEIGIVGHLPTYSGVTVVEDVRGQHVMRASSGTSLTRMPTREIDHCTVVLRGETFTLYRDQIEFDAPNYFTALFLDAPREPTVALSRSPELFRIIVDYLSGYNVLPLATEMVPPTMTRETALANLLNDAEYYQLGGLVRLLRPAPSSLIAPLETYRFRRLAPRAILRFEGPEQGEAGCHLR
ncbi:hypothetical protein EXIGLDRAFT_226377 [Exidia glandulosa HHB12029]|uniref:BTB domain-containing protein n=1 Tax=Exidia glandulosa HHB12029 TaxID=1314781 RepID=A0A165ZWX8_EXIGL|nr:hypothetical protein EXIGLDRAFT_226377 [Exidia glandulosa HHB12029]